MKPDDSIRRRWKVLLAIAILFCLTGCFSFHTFAFTLCPSCPSTYNPPSHPVDPTP